MIVFVTFIIILVVRQVMILRSDKMDTRKAVKTYHRNLAIVLAIIVAIFAAIPLVVDKPYIINIFVLTFYMSTLSMAWNILGGITGQNSLGLAAYMGLGAYVCCLVVTKTGMNPGWLLCWICSLWALWPVSSSSPA